MAEWVDFKKLRAQIKFEDVLRHYKVEIRADEGKQHQGFCPLPKHQGEKRSPSFSANLEKGIFQCFGCKAKGNMIDFAAFMEGLNPDDGGDVRKAALILQEKFATPQTREKKPPKEKRHEAPQLELLERKTDQQVVVNAPLDFELKRLDPAHPYLDKRGFTKDTIAHFGLGFCAKGLLAGRIAIPLHNQEGQLIGYAGRIVDDRLICEEHPKYKFPPKREHEGVLYEFDQVKFLYNGHRIRGPVECLAVVEGFSAVWWLTQMGFPNVVGLMGWSCSEEQANIITKLVAPSGRVWVIPDGNENGKRCVASVFERIAPLRFVQWLKLDEGKQPTDYPGGYYRKRFEG